MAVVMNGDVLSSKSPFVRSAYNYDMDLASEAAGLFCADPSLAQQNYKEETDINTIVRRFGLTGELPNDFAMPQNVDIVDQVSDYHSALNAVRAASEEFARLPPELRARFSNDPQRLIDFVGDDANVEEAGRLGLLKERDPIPEPLEVRIAATQQHDGGDNGGTVTT